MISGNTEKEDKIDENKRSENISPAFKMNMLNTPSILAGLSHEVRTYMNSIVAFTFLSNNETCTEDERKEYNDHIMNSCDQLITLFDNFLDSALIDSSTPQYTLSSCKPDKLLQDTVDEVESSLSAASREKISLVIDMPQDSESFFIDREKINRVIKNLLFNALETTESGYIKTGFKKKKNNIEFYVIDSGNGYTRNRELLRCENLSGYLRKHNNTFTTISFILSQKLIASMNGEMWIKPNGVNGTAVYFSIPERTTNQNEKKETISSRIAI